jgi:hypothetical protein
MPDAQDVERHALHAARAHQLQAKLDQAIASNARLTSLVGKLYDENALLKYELGGDVTERVRSAAFAVVQAEWEAASLVCVNQVGDGEWRAIRGCDAAYGEMRGTMAEAVAERGAQ